ncbi:amino acid permease [Legionella maioricensis]|uniref:Amino acid permease n=1 Tax=Legionella maioricensis TaxID=2896528 RepID=A0A9X2D0I5_9GAMM|nr:amino acid permease [Legionella maioricensis]MCL9684340.1 amino acid permease [Legionella maioricensis]MCL9688768.1 amino acid permease [Legionella maioricensis]
MDLFRKKDIQTEKSAVLLRCLSAFDLTLLGIGAIIGAGIFVITGVVAATDAGPAIVLSYIITGFACLFTALSYAELATSIGGCGSAYGYAYVGFGELIAWIIGWDLLLEYSISIAAVAVGWSSYFNSLLLSLNIEIPKLLLQGPGTGGIINSLALIIIGLLALMLIGGAKISTRFNNIIVCIKLSVILLFIIIAATHVETKNWVPFMPFGWAGIAKGASLIFFAYIGFDAVSTTAEEVINPQRDLPIGIIGSLFIATILYIVVSGLLTGIVSYKLLNVASPISYALILIGYKTAASIISIGAIAGLTTVMLVLFYGLSRIFFAMARDGLLPDYFAALHEKTQTPARIILFCALLIGFVAALVPMGTLAELVNIGTLVAFAMVCSGVLILHYTKPDLPRPFKTPCMPYVPILGILSCLYLIINLPWFTIFRFIVWFVIGMFIYCIFGYKHSMLGKT